MPGGIGVIGLGRIVMEGHMPSYLDAGLDVVAAADLNPEAVAEFRRRYPGVASVGEDIEAVLADEDVAFVDIATPPSTHAELIRAAADHGKSVLVQKPLALSLDEAIEVVGYAEERGVTLAVNHNLRYMPCNQAVKGWLEEGSIGEPHLLTLEYHTTLDYGPWRAALAHMIISEVVVHHLDLTRWWLGPLDRLFTEEGVAASSTDGVATVASTSGRTESGAVFHLVCDLLNPGDAPILKVRIDGENGSIRSDGRIARRYTREPLEVWEETVPGPGDWKQGIGFMPAFAAIMSDFQDAVDSGRAPLTDAKDNLQTLGAVFAAHQAADSGSVVGDLAAIGSRL
ncbi:MAG TPA: Gfo/Idh/MocA family oxidoreductase [Solirubrobacterales bacterium]|nr:Gfo/Idh/MocA family oxidoreductase [Solirubrobacterales bacterium]